MAVTTPKGSATIGGQRVGGGTVSTPITVGGGSATIGGQRVSGRISSPITITGGGGAGTGYSWQGSQANSSGTIKLEGADADIIVQGKSMKAWMEGVEQRLCILEPKPELLKKYKALEQAYEHYKTLEAMLYEQE